MLVPALGTAPEHVKALTVIAKKAHKRLNRLTREQGEMLRSAGVEVEPGWFGKSVGKRFKELAAKAARR